MIDRDWTAIAGLLDKAWKGSLDTDAAEVYRTFLDDYDPRVIVAALRRLQRTGCPYLPAVAEIVALVDPSPPQPTFDEALRLIATVHRARPPYPGHAITSDETTAAKQARLRELPPVVQAFVDRQGLDRLANLPLDDPQWGEKHRRDLEHAWDRHIEADGDREIAALASGGRGELARLHPLASLTSPRPQLTP